MVLFRKLQQLRLDLKRVAYTLRHSITRRLFLVAFSIYLLVTIIVTLIHMDYEYETSKHQTITALKNTQVMVHNSISQAIWEKNATQLETILTGLYDSQRIVGVKLEIPENYDMPRLHNKDLGMIEDDQGNIVMVNPLNKTSEVVHKAFLRLIPYKFTIYHNDAHNQAANIGTMYLYSSSYVVFEQVKYSFLIMFINSIIKTVTLWIFFLWAGYYFISKPLAQLTEAIKQLASGNYSQLNAPSKKSKNKTEINTLFETFNDMSRNLRTTEEKLRHSRNRLNTIFETMPSALCSVNNHNIIQGWNKNMSKVTGIDSQHAIGHNLTEIYPDLNEYVHLVHTALKTNKEQVAQHVTIGHDVEKHGKLYHIAAYPIKTIFPPEVVIRIDDVTEQVKSETGLAQVEKLASVGASIAGVAHEINNPLAAIMLDTQNIMRRLDPNMESNKLQAAALNLDLNNQYKYLEEREVLKFLQSINDSGARASSIVKNMLKFTRRATEEMSKHNITEIINDALQLSNSDVSIQEHIDLKDIRIEKQNNAMNVEIECYPMEIQQVILNLLRNAVQAIDPQQPNKTIKIELSKVADDKISIQISDNGRGISKENLTQIFQPFFTTKPVGKGTGLGLSVCRNIIVQRHHGTMEVESTEGKGTTFTITLPIQQAK